MHCEGKDLEMNRIFLLDDFTINKIAVGEVVERPASVIKELVENSIDAAARRITVEVIDGGKTLIKVSDDGEGILPEDIPLAFQRHSTSKLRNIEDIQKLYTNGFRGEALSSIAAVARIELMTNTDDGGIGKKVRVIDGKIQSTQDVGMKKGTVLKVEDLFYNIPARKKFMKTSATESMQINDTLSKLAIVNSEVAIKYVSNGREVFNTVGDGQMNNAITSIYGKSISAGLIPIRYQNSQILISGYISKTSQYQSNRKKENIFFNNRIVRNSPLSYVVENIYKDLIPIGKYPAFFINIEVDPSHIDPNVHPSKMEVKLDNEVDISTPLSECIREALFRESRNLIPEARIHSSSGFRRSPEHTPLSGIKVPLQIETEHVEDETKFSRPSFAGEAFEYKEFVIDRKNPEGSNVEVIVHEDSATLDAYSYNFPSMTAERNAASVVESHTQENLFNEESGVLDYSNFEVIGVIMGTYIVVTFDQSMFLIDQHAAHERVMYEKFMRQLSLEKGIKISSQELLIAELREFSTFEHDILLSHKEIFEKIGYGIEDFGFNRIAVRSYPLLFEKEQGMDLFDRIADFILEEKKVDLNHHFNDKIAKMACKSAVKANQKVEPEEIKVLFDKLNQCKNKYTCPHGRPIFVEWTQREIEKMFKRIV